MWRCLGPGWKGNLCERSLASLVSLFILFPCTALAVYYLLLQTFVLRLEFLLSAVLLCFYGLEFLLGLLSISAFSRWLSNFHYSFTCLNIHRHSLPVLYVFVSRSKVYWSLKHSGRITACFRFSTVNRINMFSTVIFFINDGMKMCL